MAWAARGCTFFGWLLPRRRPRAPLSASGGFRPGSGRAAPPLLPVARGLPGRRLGARAPLIGAFLSPVAVAVLGPGLCVRAGAGAGRGLRRPLLPVHIAMALVGLAAFAVATAVALLYLLMERRLKSKRFGPFFSRLPSLQLLDELNRKGVLAGLRRAEPDLDHRRLLHHLRRARTGARWRSRRWSPGRCSPGSSTRGASPAGRGSGSRC